MHLSALDEKLQQVKDGLLYSSSMYDMNPTVDSVSNTKNYTNEEIIEERHDNVFIDEEKFTHIILPDIKIKTCMDCMHTPETERQVRTYFRLYIYNNLT